MNITVSMDLLTTIHLSEQELLTEIAVMLCRQGRLTSIQGAELARVDWPAFQRMLAERQVPAYTPEAFHHDLNVTGFTPEQP
jgi:predicted HTH domain antitoxin